jgi:hypothetical protein
MHISIACVTAGIRGSAQQWKLLLTTVDRSTGPRATGLSIRAGRTHFSRGKRCCKARTCPLEALVHAFPRLRIRAQLTFNHSAFGRAR